jgi:hypothetical protein
MTDEKQAEQTEASPQPAVDSLLAGNDVKELDFAAGKPEGFPDEFWATDKNSPDINKLFTSYQQEKKRAEGLRVKLSKGEFEGKAPENINEYTLELKEELKQFVPDDDPIIAKAREAAKAAGLPKEAFNKMMVPLIEEVVAMQQNAIKPPTLEEIAEKKEAEFAKIGSNGKTMAQAVNTWITGLAANGRISQQDVAVMQGMVYNAETLKLMNRIRTMIDPNPAPIHTPVSTDSSKEEIAAKMAKAGMEGDEVTFNKYAAMLRQAG